MDRMLRYIILITFSSISMGIDVPGYVYDYNQNPIYNAEVYIKSINGEEKLQLATISDKEGYFILKDLNVESNDYTILITHIGFESSEINISSSNTLKINLRQNVLDTDQITVTALGYNAHIKDTPIITQVITSNDIMRSSYSTLQDVIQFAIPNIQKVHDAHGNDRVKIQGLDNKFVVFMVDGKRINGEFAGNIDFSMISLSDIEKIEFIKSGMSTLYGSDAMGGVVNIITKKHDKPRLYISYNYDLPMIQTTTLDIDFNYNNFFYKLHADYNDTPGYDLTEYSISKTYEEQVYFKFTNSLEYKADSWSLKYVNKYYSKKINQYYKTAEGIIRLDERNPRYFDYFNSISFRHSINKNFNFELNLSNDLYNKSIYFPYYYIDKGEVKPTAYPHRFDLRTAIQYMYNNHSFYVGFDYSKETYQGINVPNPIYDSYIPNPDSCLNIITNEKFEVDENGCDEENDEILFNNGEYPNEYILESIFANEDKRVVDEYSIFLTDRFKIGPFEFVLGNRFTQYSHYAWKFIPSFSIRLDDDSSNYRFNYAKGYRIPSLKELYYSFEGHNPPIYGNPNLTPSLSNYYSISIESIKLSNSYLEIYMNDIEDMISYVSMEQDNSIRYTNSDQINLYGINLSLRKSFFDNYLFEILYSFTDGESNTINSETLLEGISKHGFNMKMNYNFYKNINIVFSTKYASGKYVVVFGSGGKRYLPEHMISDLVITNRWKNVNLKLGVKNLFNYLDPARLDSASNEHLTSIDPGRRIYFNIGITI